MKVTSVIDSSEMISHIDLVEPGWFRKSKPANFEKRNQTSGNREILGDFGEGMGADQDQQKVVRDDTFW